jgi:hypothetical protein
MRQLFRLYNQDEAETVAAYAEAEQRGDVIRKRDSQGLTSATPLGWHQEGVDSPIANNGLAE